MSTGHSLTAIATVHEATGGHGFKILHMVIVLKFMLESNAIEKWLQEVEHPAKGDKNIVELGMVENIEVAEDSVKTSGIQSRIRTLLSA